MFWKSIRNFGRQRGDTPGSQTRHQGVTGGEIWSLLRMRVNGVLKCVWVKLKLSEISTECSSCSIHCSHNTNGFPKFLKRTANPGADPDKAKRTKRNRPAIVETGDRYRSIARPTSET